MKVYISENIDRVIEGFTTIPIVYGAVDLVSIPDNGASTIVCIDALDSIKSDSIVDFINGVVNKMRINCVAHFGGLDAYAVSKDLVSGKINISPLVIIFTAELGGIANPLT